MENIIGKKFNKLTAISFHHKQQKINSKGQPSGFRYFYLFKCDCGNEKIINLETVTRGLIKSCGCHKKIVFNHTIHGKTNTRLYNIWSAMKERCYNKNHKEFKYWGGKGIKVCDKWKNNFMSFYNWAINNGYKDTLSIDRINGDDNYCPENCRWATPKEQANNRKRRENLNLTEEQLKERSNRMKGNRYNCKFFIKYNNEIITLPQFSKIINKSNKFVYTHCLIKKDIKNFYKEVDLI